MSSAPPVQSEPGSDGGSEEKAASVTIYVGTDGEYAEFPVEYTGERLETGQVPVTEVLSAMAKITGWNLDLADQIYSGKGGITVTFADTCTLLTADVSEEGNQSETVQRDQLVLDSVKNASVAEYNVSTGFEAVVGFLYLSGDYARIDQLLSGNKNED